LIAGDSVSSQPEEFTQHHETHRPFGDYREESQSLPQGIHQLGERWC